MPMPFPSLTDTSKLLSKPKVFALPAGFSGCAFWRMRLPLGKLKEIGSDIEILIADNPEKTIKMHEVESYAADADVIALQAPGHDDGHMLMRLYHAQGKKVVVDYDDYSFDLDPGNPRYADLGITETPEWKDGQNGFDLSANRRKFEAFKRCVSNADLVTTTTDYLAGKFRRLNPNVKVLPNSIDFDLWKPISRPDNLGDLIRIGWFGGDSHRADLEVFKTVIPKILEKYKNVKLVLQCPPVPSWREFFKDIPNGRMEWNGWAQLKHYTLFLASRHWDIGLCPLQDSEFNRCKSSIKFFEFSALGAASVCQNMLPYAENVKHGENGFLASTDAEWFEAISTLIENESLRKEMANKAYRYVYDNFNLETNCRLWETAYRNLVGSHERQI